MTLTGEENCFLTLLPELPLIELDRIRTLRCWIPRPFPLPGMYFGDTMNYWSQSGGLHFRRLGAILIFTDHSSFIGSLLKYTHPCLISMRDTNLEGVVVESSNQHPSTPAELLVKDLN